MRITLILVQLLLLSWNSAQAFSVSRQISSCAGIRSRRVEALYSSSSSEEEEGDNGSHDENQVSPEVVEPNLTVATTTTPTSCGIEKAWRHAKKPLLRIGSKGFSKSHGNSLRQLLEDHVVVKVKLNTEKYGSLQDVATILAKLAEHAGAPPGIEYIQSREIEKTVLLGMPGTLSRIESGDFPPPPKAPWKTSAEMAAAADDKKTNAGKEL